MDFATILGLLIGFGLIITAMVLGGSPTAFVDTPSIMIVLGGTFAVTMVSFKFREMARATDKAPVFFAVLPRFPQQWD